MAVSKSMILFFAVMAVVAMTGAQEDDGSYFPGKYEGTLPYAAAPYAGYPYAGAAYPYAAYPYAGYPYAAAAAHPYAAYPYAGYAYGDDGSYFAGKYGPESQ